MRIKLTFLFGLIISLSSCDLGEEYYSIDPKLYIGWAFKVGKSFHLSPKFVIEPEIQINPLFKYDDVYYGAAVKFKYKL